jgi:hypothetical protein
VKELSEAQKSLARSRFRSSFKLDAKDIAYINKVGLVKIELHARDFIAKRLAPSQPKNDGRQTPFKGHPVFKAQHATATCCRSCLMKWHSIPKNRPLSRVEIDFVVGIIMNWIEASV